MKRKAVSTRTRFEVFKRDAFACQYCGSTPPSVILHVDHVIAVAKGGENHIDNLVTACSRCNLGKSDVSLKSVPKPLQARAAEIAEREKQLLGYQEILQARRDRLDGEMWRGANLLCDRFVKKEIRTNYLQSIRIFIERLGVHECILSVEIAMDRIQNYESCYKYFCGISWRKIKAQDALQAN